MPVRQVNISPRNYAVRTRNLLTLAYLSECGMCIAAVMKIEKKMGCENKETKINLRRNQKIDLILVTKMHC